MIAFIAEAEEAPCPTLVLDAGELPPDEAALRPLLTGVREWLIETGNADILKIALVSPSPHPLFDLDYRFVQCLPVRPDAFDFKGSCGHSILACMLVADIRRWVSPLAPGNLVRLRVLNNGDQIVCEVDESRRHGGSFTMHFVRPAGEEANGILLTGNPVDRVRTSCGPYEVSLVRFGNPYVFVDAKDLGIGSRAELFAAGDDVFEELLRIRRAASALLGSDPASVFPKIAAVGGHTAGTLSARAITVPGWHPNLALTGITCLTAAATAPGTVPARLYDTAGDERPEVGIVTPGSSVTAIGQLEPSPSGPALRWVSVGRKRVRIRSGPLEISPAMTTPPRRLSGAVH